MNGKTSGVSGLEPIYITREMLEDDQRFYKILNTVYPYYWHFHHDKLAFEFTGPYHLKQHVRTMLKAQNGPVLTCGNYIERTDGAIYVRLGDTTAYFSNNKLIAIAYQGTLYRDADETSGHVYRRLHAALQRQPCKLQKNVSSQELHAMVDVAIMDLARVLVDSKLGIISRA